MSLHDDIIRRWLDEAAADAAPRLDRAPADDEMTEVEHQITRLRLVQGLLSTLDLKTAPKELDSLVFQGMQNSAESDSEEVCEEEVEFSDWLEGVDTEPILEPRKAPEFLDRIVELRLEAMQAAANEHDQASDAHRTLDQRSRWMSPRRLMAGATLALALLATPLFLGGYFSSSQGTDGSSLRLVSYDSLEGLQRAFPNQSQAASGMGILGAFASPSQNSGGPR
ncbi:MAG: hypothetical protein ACI87O_000556 [Planctomycetota bacterium]|jgi:hypothetical protein